MYKENLETVLEHDLNTLLAKSKTGLITFQELLSTLGRGGYSLVALLISLPFAQPIQIPGFSTPFGIIIIFIGLHMAFGKVMWWPKWLLNKVIPHHLLETIIKKTLWLINKIKKILRPRLTTLVQGPIISVFNGIVISLMGLFLALPLPIPLSNIAAAWAIILIALGIIGNDGLFIMGGYLISFLCIVILLIIIKATIHFLSSF